jgi:hypothetical protein
MVRSALRLYGVTYSVAGLRFDEYEHVDQPRKPLDQALFTLREIAAGWGLLTRPWEPSEIASLSMPTRLRLERTLRFCRADEWAERLGHPLKLTESRSDFEAWLENAVVEPTEDTTPGATAQGAEDFAGIATAYGRNVDRYEDPEERYIVQAAMYRDHAPRLMQASRNKASWFTHHQPVELQAVGAALIHMSNGFFILSWKPDSDEIVYPSKDALRGMVGSAAVRKWMAENPTGFPEWLHQAPAS